MIVREAALLLGLSEVTIRRYIADGSIVASKVVGVNGYTKGKKEVFDIPDDEIQKWMDKLVTDRPKRGRHKKEVITEAPAVMDIPKPVIGEPIIERGGRVVGYRESEVELKPIKYNNIKMEGNTMQNVTDIFKKDESQLNTTARVNGDKLSIRIDVKAVVDEYLMGLSVDEFYKYMNDIIVRKNSK